jgi:enoyl-CoA hydratase/carnithine racemase
MAPVFAAGEPLTPHHLVDPLGLRPPWRRKPLVAAVQGTCLTIGIELMLAADIVVAAEDCRFAQLEVRRGLMAAGGATIRFAERAGWGAAMRWLLTGDEFDAATALRLGFVQEVVPAGQQRQAALALGVRIAAQAPLAVEATITSMRTAALHGPAAAAQAFDAVQQRLMATDDAAEGVASFRERRQASFSGQ